MLHEFVIPVSTGCHGAAAFVIARSAAEAARIVERHPDVVDFDAADIVDLGAKRGEKRPRFVGLAN